MSAAQQMLGVAPIFSDPCDVDAYGMREVAVRDPDGHVLIFAHDISSKGAANG